MELSTSDEIYLTSKAGQVTFKFQSTYRSFRMSKKTFVLLQATGRREQDREKCAFSSDLLLKAPKMLLNSDLNCLC